MRFSESWLPMNRKHFLFMTFQLKSVCRDLPRLLICFAIIGLIILVAGICGNGILNSKKGPLNIKVGTVTPDNDIRVQLGFAMIGSMESLNDVCTFEKMDLDTAKDKLQKGEIAFIAYVPENLVDDIMGGVNQPGYVITPENANTETLLFCSVLDAGCHTFSYVQAGVYAVEDFLVAQGCNKYQIKEANEDINAFYIKYALNRSKFFTHQSVSATGNTSVKGYYLVSGMLLLLMLCSLTLGRHFSKYSTEVLQGLRRCNINTAYLKFTEMFGISAVFFGITTLIIIIGKLTIFRNSIHLNPLDLLWIFLIIMSLISFIMFMNSIGKSRLASTIMVFLLTTVMMYVCGRFIPSAYLPESVQLIGNFLPLSWWAKGLESALFSNISWVNLLLSVGIGIVFYGGSVLAEHIKGRAFA